MAAKKKAKKSASAAKAAGAKFVHVQLVGGEVKTYVMPATLGQLKDQLKLGKHQATINGDVEDNDSVSLVAGSLIIFTEKVKGA